MSSPITPNILDRALGFLSPALALNRLRARAQTALVARHYEAASGGRRTSGWRRTSGDANASMRDALARLRENTRDLVRNNPHAASALDAIGDDVVNYGIKAKPRKPNRRAKDLWDSWANTTACDADGRNDMAGLQKLVLRTVAESGEVLVRRRVRRPGDTDANGTAFPIPLQLQVLEPDYIDTLKTGITLPNGGRIVAGIEFDPIGRRVAYWLFPEHPGSEIFGGATTSQRIPAEGILHVFRHLRPGQIRGASWFAAVILKMKDFDEYDDAQLMKQKVAALLGVMVSDINGDMGNYGTTDPERPTWDYLEPGAINHISQGSTVEVIQPPRVSEFRDYSEVTLRTIAAGIGLPYERLTGDYTNLPFSAARMSRLSYEARVHDWRWRMLIPQFCDPVWFWAMQAAVIMGAAKEIPAADWTPPPLAMLNPNEESQANQRQVRNGQKTWPEMVRELGFDPEEQLAEIAAWNKKFDKAGVVLDSDPRQVSQQGQEQASETAAAAPKPKPKQLPLPDMEDDE